MSNKMKDDTNIALYRKYRPHTFADVRGQEPIVKALQGAIAKDTIPHALLFAGSRGTGKTSVARIFAEAIGASAIDTYEIDAASNRGIDDIRALREAVHTLPYESKRKVYIIDEVHMLTKDAFNALLKTLEEPPHHVVFILATTEVDKILETILSRCQVFNFKSPTRAILKDRVRDVAKAEKFELSPEGAELIAIAADGSFRDALGITEKVIMASLDTKANGDEVALIIGAPKGTLLMGIVEGIAERNAQKCISLLRSATDANLDMKLFARLLLERVRAILLLRYAPEDAAVILSSWSEEDQVQLTAYAKDAKSPFNSKLLVRLIDAANDTGRTHIASLPLELAVIDLCGEHA